jgi:hypothetical protein
MRKGPEVLTTSVIYSWSFVPEIFHSGQPSHGGDRKTFEVMTSTCFLLHLLFIYSLIEKTVTVNNIINHNKITYYLTHTSYSLTHTSYSLTHTSYSLTHTSYSLTHTSYSLSHTSYSLSHTSYSLTHTSYSLTHMSYSLAHTSYSLTHTSYSLIHLKLQNTRKRRQAGINNMVELNGFHPPLLFCHY